LERQGLLVRDIESRDRTKKVLAGTLICGERSAQYSNIFGPENSVVNLYK